MRTEFKVGDRVVLKPREELETPGFKNQEVGIGIITSMRATWCDVKWENGSSNSYRHTGEYIDLVKKETGRMTITISEENVRKAYQEGCEDVRAVLKTLFPEVIKATFNWEDFYSNPGKYITISGGEVDISEEVLQAYRDINHPISGGIYPETTLGMLARLFQFLVEHCPSSRYW